MSEKPEYVPKVFGAISAITAELSKVGIAKDRKNDQQNYKFRGIDDMHNALSPLLAKHKLVILPEVEERIERIAKSNAGKDLNFVVLKVRYSFISAEDASIFHVVTMGEGMDSADKATNKALSAAYKYAVIQAFSIPVEGTPDADADSDTIDRSKVAEAAPEKQPEDPDLDDEIVAAIKKRIKDTKASEEKLLKFFELTSWKKATKVQLRDLDAWLKEREAKNADSSKG